MSKAEPTIQKFMTYQPHAIAENASVIEADKMMAKFKIRHLPVMEGDKIIGILSERDLKTALGTIGADFSRMKVVDVCQLNPYIIAPDHLLHEVCDTMATHHYGSAIVSQNGKLVGIFTMVDVCRALSTILQTRFHSH